MSHWSTGEDTFFLSTHGTFNKIDHILDSKTPEQICKNETMQSMLLNYNGIELGFSITKLAGKCPYI